MQVFLMCILIYSELDWDYNSLNIGASYDHQIVTFGHCCLELDSNQCVSILLVLGDTQRNLILKVLLFYLFNSILWSHLQCVSNHRLGVKQPRFRIQLYNCYWDKIHKEVNGSYAWVKTAISHLLHGSCFSVLQLSISPLTVNCLVFQARGILC